MNFKQWLENEEEIDVNVSKPNLATTVPPLNASASKPKLGIRQNKSKEKVEQLALDYKKNGYFPNAKHPLFGQWISDKRTGDSIIYPSDREAWKNMVELSKSENWKYKLPETPPFELGSGHQTKHSYAINNNIKNITSRENIIENKSKEKVEQLALFYKKNGYFPNAKDPVFGQWISDKRTGDSIIYPSDNIKWKEMVELSKSENWKYKLPENLPFEYNYKYDIQNKRNKRIEDLAIYYRDHGKFPNPYDEHDEFARNLGHFRMGNIYKNNISSSDNIKWKEMVELSKSENWKYTLPDKWNEIQKKGGSSGEIYIKNLLDVLKIENYTQHKETFCVDKRCLRFDFSIDHNNQDYLVEYQGKQHYIPSFFGKTKNKNFQKIAEIALKEFNKIKKRDEIKYDYCKKENLPLLVIPYWFDKGGIKELIEKFIKEDEFSTNFANPPVPDDKKIFHDRMYKKYLAESKPTFEQFLIGKNFTYFNA